MGQPDTKQRILDAAESLFARDGFHSTSMRAITGLARANLAAVNYHFGSKEALIEAVFERRLLPLNEIRLEKLRRVGALAEQDGGRPDPKEVLRAFIAPTLQFRDTCPGSHDFITLVGRALNEPDETVRTMFIERIRPVFLLLFDLLHQGLPELDRSLLFWRLQFALGAMGHVMCRAGRFQSLPDGIEPPQDTEALIRMFLDFVTAGMEAP